MFVQDQHARFDLGKIQNIVDDREQGLTAQANGVDKIVLFLVQLGVQQQGRHPDQRVERRANFMAHVGQELGLDARGGLGRILGPGQLLFRLLQLGDVAADADQPFDLALRIVQGQLALQQPERPLLAVVIAGDGAADDRRLGAHDLLFCGVERRGRGVWIEVKVGLPDDVIQRLGA